MPPRAKHLPNIHERSVLQKLSKGALPVTELRSAATVAKMLDKGWIERGSSDRVFRITPAGEAAGRAELSLNKGNRPAIAREN